MAFRIGCNANDNMKQRWIAGLASVSSSDRQGWIGCSAIACDRQAVTRHSKSRTASAAPKRAVRTRVDVPVVQVRRGALAHVAVGDQAQVRVRVPQGLEEGDVVLPIPGLAAVLSTVVAQSVGGTTALARSSIPKGCCSSFPSKMRLHDIIAAIYSR